VPFLPQQEDAEGVLSLVARDIEHALRLIYRHYGVDDLPPGMRDTPSRVASMYVDELFSGLSNPITQRYTTFEAEDGMDQMVAVHHIPFTSLCEHHLLPFTGEVHVGYIPKGTIIGLSKIPRLIKHYASRPQVQERLTVEVANALDELLLPQGVIVVVEARHLCMEVWGVQSPGRTTTSAVRGVLADNADQSRNEFLSLIAQR
jgi:GTP cyclohydrolase IA